MKSRRLQTCHYMTIYYIKYYIENTVFFGNRILLARSIKYKLIGISAERVCGGDKK